MDSFYTVIFTEQPDNPVTVLCNSVLEAATEAEARYRKNRALGPVHAVIWTGDVPAHQAGARSEDLAVMLRAGEDLCPEHGEPMGGAGCPVCVSESLDPSVEPYGPCGPQHDTHKERDGIA